MVNIVGDLRRPIKSCPLLPLHLLLDPLMRFFSCYLVAESQERRFRVLTVRKRAYFAISCI